MGKTSKFDSSKLAMMIVIILSFTAHLFIYGFSTTGYIALLVLAVLLYLVGKPLLIDKSRETLFWLLFIAVVILGGAIRGVSLGSLLDVIGLITAMILVLFYDSKPETYRFGLKVIIVFAVFFAVGVLLQQFLFGIYDSILTLFPSGFRSAVRLGVDYAISNSGRRGFSTNSGFAAGYLCCGILAVAAVYWQKKKSIRVIVLLLTMFIALLYTGKRGPALFLMISLIICYLNTVDNKVSTKKYLNVICGILIFIGVLFMFGNFLSNIPLIGEALSTISGIASGDDVSSSRTALYTWAFQLFKENPIFGIGMGQFRTTTAGYISFKKALDVHNIYLQVLCENGIMGFVCFIMIVLRFWLMGRKMYIFSLESCNEDYGIIVRFSFLFQTFFILYGMTGNVLYDQHYQIIYGISCAIVLAYKYYIRSENVEVV